MMTCPKCGAERDHPGFASAEHQEFVCGTGYPGDGSGLRQSDHCRIRELETQLADMKAKGDALAWALRESVQWDGRVSPPRRDIVLAAWEQAKGTEQ